MLPGQPDSVLPVTEGDTKDASMDDSIKQQPPLQWNPEPPNGQPSNLPGSKRESGEYSKDPPSNDQSKGKKLKNQGFLGDAANMKDNLHENLEVKEYNVFDFYHETGYWQALAKSDKFGNLTLGVISLNAVWIGVDSDHNTKPLGYTDLQFIIADQFFCVFFSFEWLTRFMAFAQKRDCLKDGWFKFDSILVFLMVFETWITPLAMGDGGGGGMGNTSMLRLLRLLRLTRMARLMRSVPELVTLLKGMAAAVRSVSSVLVLLIIFTYVFAIIFKSQCEGNEVLEEFYGTIPEAMWNLLMAGTLLDNITSVLNDLREHNHMLCVFFLAWVLLSSFTMLNMLIGVLCEVVAAVSDAEKEKNQVSFAKEAFLTVLDRIDKESEPEIPANGTISETEFIKFVKDPDVKAPLEDLDVDRENLMGLADVIFSAKEEKDYEYDKRQSILDPSGASPSTNVRRSLDQAPAQVERELPFGDLLEQILDLRGSNPAMVSHIVDLRKHLRSNQKETKNVLREMDSEVADVKDKLQEVMDRQTEVMDRQNELFAAHNSMITNIILPMTVGIREIQQKVGCSNLIAVPPTTSLDSLSGHAQTS